MKDRSIPHVPDEPHVERARGPYEITVVTHASPRATVSVTLAPETSKARAIQAAHDYLAKSEPGVRVMVHRWEKGAHPTAEPTPDQLVHHAHLDEERRIRRIVSPEPAT